MSHAKGKQAAGDTCQGSYAFEALQQFVERHFVEGHEVRMFLDTEGAVRYRQSGPTYCAGNYPANEKKFRSIFL